MRHMVPMDRFIPARVVISMPMNAKYVSPAVPRMLCDSM